MPLRTLFVDMNSFFASCEQQEKPYLRGKPVAVIPTQAETTSCIAASIEAKRFGVKTGTPVWEARKLCPGLVCVEADHQRYVIMHHRIVDAVGSVLPVDHIRSVDEMSCRLAPAERSAAAATAIAHHIKAAIRSRAGDYLSCSIGAGPNEMLAKVAADMRKPDGLVVLPDDALPGALHRLQLNDFPGVGPRMERRLRLMGIFSVEQLCAAPARMLAEVWGSKMLGEKWHRLLRGEDVCEKPTRRQTVGHSHILPPALRTDAGAYAVMVRLTHKAAARMRKIGYWAGAVSIGVSYRDDDAAAFGWGKSGWSAWRHLTRCQDTPGIVRVVADLWKGRPSDREPFKVGMVLSDLVPARSATPSLFEEDQKATELSHAMDAVNREFGASVVYLGSMFGMRDAAPNRIAFTQIPDLDRDVS
jgi:DNA polymerase-4